MTRARGAAAMGAGSAIAGLLAYVFFAMTTRAIGAEAAAGVSVLWTYWSFAAAAVTFPIQHWVVRTVSAADGREGGVRRALPRVAVTVLAVGVVTTVGSWLARDALFHRSDAAFPILVGVVTLGSGLVAVVRGVLTARHALAAAGATLVMENGLRCLLAAGLIVYGSQDARLFGLALALGQVVALAWPAALRLGDGGSPEPWLRFMTGAAAGQVAGQILLTSGPVVLTLLDGTPATVTSLFAALALFRLPYTLAMGVVPVLTGMFTRLVGARSDVILRRVMAVLIGGTLIITATGSSAAYLWGPWALQLVFGDTVELSPGICALLAVGSLLALGSVLVTVLVFAHGRSGATGRCWVAAVLVATGVVVIAPSGPVWTVAMAFLAGETVAFVLLAGYTTRLLVWDTALRE